MNALAAVLADLEAEGEHLDSVVARLDEAGWRTPTPAEGWDVATSIAHLAWTDEAALKAATDKEAWDALVLAAFANPTGFVDEVALAEGAVPPEDLLSRWRAGREALVAALRAVPTGHKLPWFGPPMSATSMATARFMETWAHGLDVQTALGIEPEHTDRIRHVAHLGVRTRNFSFANQGLEPPAQEFRIDLVSPSGEVWSWGPEDAGQTVTGEATEFCLLVTQRINRADTGLHAGGPDADRWLDIAQAFAGPPGNGRAPR